MDLGPTRSLQKLGEHAQSLHDADSSAQFPDNAKESHAAHVIQKAWKRWQDMAVFDYYKGLIGFKQCGKPSSLMKYIEPREAEYLDAAAGIHIRFRLGGLKFPPSIYYKIFTHRPIVDVCAYSPKDYAKLALKTREARKREEKKGKDYNDWYKRIENNGWRLLSHRFWKIIDPITNDDNNKTKEFQYSRLMRKQEVEKRRKRRKIEWLKKMYFGQNLQVNTVDPITTVLIQRATEGLIGSLDKGIDRVMEWEVDEVLKWTNALNYEGYIKQWREIGTSKASEGYRGFQFSERRHGISSLSQTPQKLQEMVHSHMT